MTAVGVLIVGLFGLVIGSFLNVIIHRVPIRESIVWPSSKCPHCGEGIAPRDNIPLVSYLLLRGRCRNCKEPISPRYPAVEALTGVLFGAAAYTFGLSLQLALSLVLISTLVALAGTDLEYRLLPNVIVGPAALVGFGLAVAVSPERWWVYLVSAVALAGALFLLAIARPGGMGMGDVKMGGMLGAFLGPYAALAVFVGALLGAVLGGVLMAAGRMQRRTALPFGVFMAIGGVLSLFFGEQAWNWYLSVFGGA